MNSPTNRKSVRLFMPVVPAVCGVPGCLSLAAVVTASFLSASGDAWGQADVYWRSEATSGTWVDSGENRWYRTSDISDIRRPDLAEGHWHPDDTKQSNNLIFANGNQTTMTVNTLGGSDFLVHQLRFENSANRTLTADGATFSMGGGSENAKIEAVANSGTGSYTIHVPLTLTKITELNPVGGNLTFGREITNNGHDIHVWGTAGKTLTFDDQGAISGTGGFRLRQASTVVFNASQSYTGATVVDAGTLFVNGQLASQSIQVGTGATLGGTGTLDGDLSFDTGSVFHITDLLQPLTMGAGGTVSFGAGFGIANLTGLNWDTVAMNAYTIISGTQSFNAANIDNFGVANAADVGSTGRKAYFDAGSLQLVVIPEPSVALLGGLGLLALLRRRR